MININMIAERRATRMREVATLRYMSLGVICVLLFSILLNVEKWYECQDATTKKHIVMEELKKQDKKREELAQVNDKIDQRIPVKNLLEQVRVSESAWMTILADTSRVTPDDVYLSSFSTSAGGDGITLHVGGLASDAKTVGLYMTAIREKTAWAQMATVSSVSAQDDEKYGRRERFDLTIPIRNLIGGDL